MNEMAVGVLGGGLSGLTLGFLLNQRGVDFELLEKESECGGLIRSTNKSFFTFDYGGSHILFSKDKEVLNFILNILGNNVIRNKRNTKILYNGRYVKYPFENGLSNLSKEENFECLYFFIKNLINAGKEQPGNLQEWCYSFFGKGITEKYLIPYNEKIWKYSSDKLGLDWVERIPKPPFEDIIKSSLGIETEGYIDQLYFYYPRTGGIQALSNAIESEIKNRIVKNYSIKHIERKGNCWIVSNGDSEKIYDKIISTIPLQELISAMNHVPDEVVKATHALKFNSLISVMVGTNDYLLNDYSWLYIPDKSVLMHRVSFPPNFSSFTVPQGKSSLLAEITCNFEDLFWNMNDKDIIERTISDLSKLNIIKSESVCYANVRKIKYAYVVNDLNYRKNLELIYKYLNDIGIDIVGRFGEYKYLNMDGCIRSAFNYMRSCEDLHER